MSNYIIKEVLNNSSVLVDDQGKELILVGKGIGFQQKRGNSIDKNQQFAKKYYAMVPNNEDLDSKFIKQAACIVDIISEQINKPIEGQALASLTNHLVAMLIRIEKNDEFINPFHSETKALYASSYQLSEIVANKIKTNLKLELPEAEIGFITLYIHNLLNEHDISYNEMTNAVISEVSELLTHKYKMNLNKDSLTYARFVVHIKFVIQRILRDEKLENLAIIDEIFHLYEKYVPIAQEISMIISEQIDYELGNNEVAYILLYVARLYAEEKPIR